MILRRGDVPLCQFVKIYIYERVLETLYNELNVLEIIRRGRLSWAGYVCRNQKSLIRAVMEQSPRRRENTVGKTANTMEGCFKRGCETVGKRI